MQDKELERQAAQLTADTGTIVRMLVLSGFQFTRLTSIRDATVGSMSRRALCDAVDYLTDGGYIELRTSAEGRPGRVADIPMESLEAKLTQKGRQLALHKLTDPLVDA